MNYIEIVISGIVAILTLIIGILMGRVMGRKQGRDAMNTDIFIWKNYEYYKNMTEKQGHREDQIMARLMETGTQRQVEALRDFYNKYKKERDQTEVKEFKKQFKDEPLGKQLTEAIYKQ